MKSKINMIENENELELDKRGRVVMNVLLSSIKTIQIYLNNRINEIGGGVKNRYLILLIIPFLFLISSYTVLAELVDLGTYKVVKTNETIIQRIPGSEKASEEVSKNLPLMANANLPEDNDKQIADKFIIDGVGEDYFNTYFSFNRTEKREFFTLVIYNFNYDDYSTEMFVAVSKDGKIIPQFSHILKESQIISFDSKKATNKADDLILPTPRKISLIYSEKVNYLSWRIDWDHIPTIEERMNETISGYIFRGDNGDLVETLKFKIEPVQEDSKVKSNIIVPIIICVVLVVIIFLKKVHK
jgi:hypothetical protein